MDRGHLAALSDCGLRGSLRFDYGGRVAQTRHRSATGRNFYAIQSSARQGVHKSLFATGRFTALVGADVGPSFSQNTSSLITAGKSAITVSFSSSFIATGVVQLNPAFSFVVPLRMLYISGIGWNPVLEAGVVINLKNLPKAKP